MTSQEAILTILLSRGILTEEQGTLLRKQAPAWSKKLAAARGGVGPWLPELLESMGVKGADGIPLTEDGIMEAVAAHLRLPFRRIDPLKLDLEVVTQTLPKRFVSRNLMIPLELTEGVLTVAVSNPFDVATLEDLGRVTGHQLALVISPRRDITKIINEFYGFRSSVDAAEKEIDKGLDLGNLEHFFQVTPEAAIDSSDRHIINAVDHLFRYALDQRASDIHVEPKRDKTHIRIRIDGVLHLVYALPVKIHAALVSRVKSLARMDIAEKRRPQDGRLKISFRGREIELRASTLPTAFGEKMVLRLFDPDILIQRLEKLGLSRRDRKAIEGFMTHTHGIILVTGPTGSGKTTTLYSMLSGLSDGTSNIVTIEDPVEMVHQAFNQVNVNPAIDLTFASALRTILRQDPDIIMVGEIRDEETARNAVQAALTGHLVLSTLHTNDAATAVVRLIDLGVPSYLISATLIGVMAQRLVRVVCPHCKEKVPMTTDDLEPLGVPLAKGKAFDGAKGKGCHLCRQTGFLGRNGIFEVLTVSPSIQEMINRSASLQEITAQARKEGMKTLRENGVLKVTHGETTVAEAVRAVFA
jgi:general secretion pathway protein E